MFSYYIQTWHDDLMHGHELDIDSENVWNACSLLFFILLPVFPYAESSVLR